MILPLVNRGQEPAVARSAFKKLKAKVNPERNQKMMRGFWVVLADLTEGWGSGGPGNGPPFLPNTWEVEPVYYPSSNESVVSHSCLIYSFC